MKPMGGLTEDATAALEARGIDPELADRHGVVSAEPDRQGDRRAWLAFPHGYGDDGTHWQFRTLTGGKQFLSSSDTARHRTFFNEAAVRDRSLGRMALVITEGQMDCLAVLQAGYQRAVSVPDGAPSSSGEGDAGKAKYAYLSHYETALADLDAVILATDDDNPGRALRADLAARIGSARCKFVTWPKGCKDANDVLVRHGPEALLAAIAEAKWINIEGFYSRIADIPALPQEAPCPSGIRGLDTIWRPRRGDLTVLVGTPGSGKTTLINQIVVALGHAGWITTFASFEVYPNPNHANLLRQAYLEHPPHSDEEVAQADAWIDDHVSWIVPDRDTSPTFEWIFERLKAGVLRDNASLLVIDPWNQVDHTVRPADVTVTEYAGVMLRRLAQFARDYRAHVLLAVHPAKMPRDKDGKVPMPTGYDIADSAHFVNRPDSGLTIYRKAGQLTKIGCWKCRYENVIGRLGQGSFSFDQVANRFFHSPQDGDSL